MNGWRGFPVASCVNRHPWFLRGGFAVAPRVSVVALFCGRSVSALFSFGGSSAVAGWSVFLCGRSLFFSVVARLSDCSEVALCLLFGSSVF